MGGGEIGAGSVTGCRGAVGGEAGGFTTATGGAVEMGGVVVAAGAGGTTGAGEDAATFRE